MHVGLTLNSDTPYAPRCSTSPADLLLAQTGPYR